MSDSARKFMACCVAWRVRGARARAWLVGGRWHGGGRERTGGCVERVTPQHPVRRRCASLKPVHQVPTAHAAKALAVAAVEDDRVARLHGQTQWRWRLWRRLARAPEALAGRPVHWRGAVKSVESRPDPQGARYAVEAQQQEWSPSREGGWLARGQAPYSRQRHLGLHIHMVTGCAHLQLDLGLRQVPAHLAAVVEAVLRCDRHK